MILNLKPLLEHLGLRQSKLATHLGVSPACVSQICNHGIFPKKPDGAAVRSGILSFLESHGADRQALSRAFDAVPAVIPETTEGSNEQPPQEEIMLLRKQTLTPAAKRHFKLFSDPFADDVNSHDDVYLTEDVRYVRETLWHTARHGGFVAVVGESGAGKSTLRRDLAERISHEDQSIVMIEPFVLGMEDNDSTGKTLKASHIAEAIINTIAPLESPKRSQEARFRQVHRLLKQGAHAKMKYLLVIEEAHSLPIPTLKHLKRFFELEDGFRKLLGIVLLGQTELRMKLAEGNHSVREVAQRCEIVELMPLDNHLEDYLRFKFKRTGKELDEVIDQSGIDALRAKLTFSAGRNARDVRSLIYPLAVSNLLTASMNMATHVGLPRVTADVVKEV